MYFQGLYEAKSELSIGRDNINSSKKISLCSSETVYTKFEHTTQQNLTAIFRVVISSFVLIKLVNDWIVTSLKE